MKVSRILLAIILAIGVASCDRHGVYESNITIANESWNLDSVASFSVDIADTITPHNIYINLRHTTNYPNSNLFLFITTIAPQGAVVRDTIECILADDRGRWLGKGTGRIRDNQIPYRRYVRLPVEGEYEFRIEHGMRRHNLKEVVSVGLRLERAQ